MADTVTTIVIANTPFAYVLQITGISDGSGETNVVKVNKSALLDVNNVEPAALDLQQARWNTQGYTYIKLAWAHTINDTMMVLNANGYEDYRGMAPQALRNLINTGGLKDPLSAGGTGNVLLTSVGAISGATYDITLWFTKRAA